MIIIQERLTCSILPKPFVFDLIRSQFLQLTHDLVRDKIFVSPYGFDAS